MCLFFGLSAFITASNQSLSVAVSTCPSHEINSVKPPLKYSVNIACPKKTYCSPIDQQKSKVILVSSSHLNLYRSLCIYSCNHHCLVLSCFFHPFPLRPKSNTHFKISPNPMIFLMIYCFSFILLSKSSSLKTLPVLNRGVKLSSLAWFWGESSHFLLSWFRKTVIAITSFQVSSIMPRMEAASLEQENVLEKEDMSLLDLPELALECILERLSPSGLCRMAGVCSSLRERCTGDHMWERHMKQKWGRLIGDAAYKEWQWHIASRKRSTLLNGTKQKSLFGCVSNLCPLLWKKSKLGNGIEQRSSLPLDSIMAWYLALETGKFWFPAQVYNRENGNVGFMLSCYDAELCYDSSTDTFEARYSPHGRRTIEDNIEWDRLRAPAVDTPAHVLHASDCLDDLKTGDHIEIQWRRNKEFPYGWWYGTVGHLDSCTGNKTHCQCDNSETVILEFKQYTPGSRWRQVAINRKDHREVGNAADGFYGGIRKLYCQEEISVWKRLWPAHVME